MIKAGLIGLGAMGRGHLDNFLRFIEEGSDIKLIAVCDTDPNKFKNYESVHNIKGIGVREYDFSMFNCYHDIDEMISREELDFVVVALPTFMHCEITCKCLNAGINVLCEKPMALNLEECQRMIDTANRNEKYLMIGQCERFEGVYEVLKDFVAENRLGNALSGYFFRGGSTPMHSFNGWILQREKGGGALFDQHVHDIDMVQWLFGMPKAVCSIGRTFYKGSGYDAVTTNYIYDDCKAINSQDDWLLPDSEFWITFRCNFVNGTITYDQTGFHVINRGGEDVTPEYSTENPYYKEVRYFANLVKTGGVNTVNPPEDSMKAIRIALAETKSCDNCGQIIIL
ncbi:MAG: Gfo/Idh/MocA family oxidoreductase [Clostridia bacterium]|nr:Gfo/Idh/MocA family oxidoreductase [Clostridia bacterium]